MTSELAVLPSDLRGWAVRAVDRKGQRSALAADVAELRGATAGYGLVGRMLETTQDDTLASISHSLAVEARAWHRTAEALTRTAQEFAETEQDVSHRFRRLDPR